VTKISLNRTERTGWWTPERLIAVIASVGAVLILATAYSSTAHGARAVIHVLAFVGPLVVGAFCTFAITRCWRAYMLVKRSERRER